MNVTKQYILIKEYPGSPKLGTIITQENNSRSFITSTDRKVFTHNMIENSPEFWQMLKYRVTQIKNKVIGVCTLTNEIFQGYYKYKTKSERNIWVTMQQIYDGNTSNNSIHQVVRIEDGAVFTVGQVTNRGVITEIKLSPRSTVSGMWIQLGGNSCDLAHKLPLSDEFFLQEKVKLFTTEDEVDVYEGDKCFAVDEDYKIHGPQKYTNAKSNLKFFSSHVAAADWIKDNQPKVWFKFRGKEYYDGQTIWFVSRLKRKEAISGALDSRTGVYSKSWFEDMHSKYPDFKVFDTEKECKGYINMQRTLLSGQEVVDLLMPHVDGDRQAFFDIVAKLVSKKANA